MASSGNPLGDYLHDPSVSILLTCGACGRSRPLAMKALVDRLMALRINPVTIGEHEIANLVKNPCACRAVQ